MDLREMECLLAIDKYRNITRAAQELYISPSGLNKSLKRLERNLGIQLFDWTGNYMVPTPAGREYLDFAREVLRLKRDLDARVAAIPQPQNILRIGFFLNSMSKFQNTITEFSKLYPNIQLSLAEDFSVKIKEMFTNGQLDLIFVTNFSPNPNMVAEPLSRSELLLYIPGDLYTPPPRTVPFSSYPWVDWNDLKDVPFIIMRPSPQTKLMDYKIFQENDFTPVSEIFVTNLLSRIQLAQDTPAACFLVVNPDGRAEYKDFTDYEHLYSFGTHSVYLEMSAVYSKKLSYPFYAQEFIRLVKFTGENP